jgi:hypothetical protein
MPTMNNDGFLIIASTPESCLRDGMHIDYTVDAVFAGWYGLRFHITPGIEHLCEGDSRILFDLFTHARKISNNQKMGEKMQFDYRGERIVLGCEGLSPTNGSPVVILCLVSED